MSRRVPIPALRRRRACLLVFSAALTACDGATEPTTSPPTAARIEATTPTELTGTVGTGVFPVPTVRATDDDGGAVSGVRIYFVVGSTLGTVANTAAITDEEGLATVGEWTLGHATGTYTVTASLVRKDPILFTATALAGPVAWVTPLSGGDQIGSSGAELSERLRVRVSDAFANPIGGAPVTYTVTAGGGTIEDAASVTSAAGVAEAGPWTLGPGAPIQQLWARSGDAVGVFLAHVGVPGAAQGRLAVVSNRDGNAEIYLVDADGSELERLTTNDDNDTAPAWSPDGSQIAFASNRDGAEGIYTMAADGSGVRRRTLGAHAGAPAWSPDGSTLAFELLHDGRHQVAIVGRAGGNSDTVFEGLPGDQADTVVVFLPDGPGHDGQPDWSPDGQRLAFASDRIAFDIGLDIYTMNADGTDQTLRTHGSFFPFHWPGLQLSQHPVWSPDGTMIAYVRGSMINGYDMRFQVAVMSADGVFIKDVVWAGDISGMEAPDPGAINWSPDGRGIAYSFVDCDRLTRVGCTKLRSVRYVSLDGRQHATIVADAHSPSWRP